MERLSLIFPPTVQFSDDELFDFCVANAGLEIERDVNGKLLIMSPSGGFSAQVHLKVYHQFANWIFSNESLGYGFDASGGFRLPDRSMRSPDAAFVSKMRWDALSIEEKEKFPPLCPDFVIEVRSQTDSLIQLKAKMEDWLANGCRLAWLIDPIERQAYLYRPAAETESMDFSCTLSGEDVLPGFVLDLKKI